MPLTPKQFEQCSTYISNGQFDEFKKFFDDNPTIEPTIDLLFNACSVQGDFLQFLIEKDGSQINAIHNDYGTLLHMAVRYEDDDLVRFLLANGADPSIKFEDKTAIELADDINFVEPTVKDSIQNLLLNPESDSKPLVLWQSADYWESFKQGNLDEKLDKILTYNGELSGFRDDQGVIAAFVTSCHQIFEKDVSLPCEIDEFKSKAISFLTDLKIARQPHQDAVEACINLCFSNPRTIFLSAVFISDLDVSQKSKLLIRALCVKERNINLIIELLKNGADPSLKFSVEKIKKFALFNNSLVFSDEEITANAYDIANKIGFNFFKNLVSISKELKRTEEVAARGSDDESRDYDDESRGYDAVARNSDNEKLVSVCGAGDNPAKPNSFNHALMLCGSLLCAGGAAAVYLMLPSTAMYISAIAALALLSAITFAAGMGCFESAQQGRDSGQQQAVS